MVVVVVVVVWGSQFLFYFDSWILWGPDYFATLPSFPVLSPRPHPFFVCSFPFFSCLLLCCVLTSQSLATDSRVRHSSSFFPSSRFAETKAKSLGPRFFQMLCDSVYSLFPAPVPLPSGHICPRGSHGIRGEVSTIQPVLPLIYFIPKQKTTDWNICLFSYDSSFL